MSHHDYYQFQAKARQVYSFSDIERYGRQAGPLYHRMMGRWLPDDHASPIAELACGHGSFLWWLRSCGYTQVCGVDSSSVQIDLARQVAGVTVTQADVNLWLAQQPLDSWQTLIAIDLIEHLSKDDLITFLAGANRVLRPGGHLILRYPNGDSPLVGINLFNDITHVWTYTANCLTSLSKMHGYTRAEFTDESSAAICKYRWLKVPLCRFSQAVLRWLFWAATKSKPISWSPNLWACLTK